MKFPCPTLPLQTPFPPASAHPAHLVRGESVLESTSGSRCQRKKPSRILFENSTWFALSLSLSPSNGFLLTNQRPPTTTTILWKEKAFTFKQKRMSQPKDSRKSSHKNKLKSRHLSTIAPTRPNQRPANKQPTEKQFGS